MHGNKEFWNDRALWSYNEKSCLLYKIQLVYAQYCTYISAFFSTKKGCYKHIYYNLILATFPHEGFTSSLFKSHSTGIPIAIFSLGNGA